MQHTILGFYNPLTKGITLTPVKNPNRQTLVIRVDTSSPSATKWALMSEPFHDSNKLYTFLKGHPRSEIIHDADLEDVGFEDTFSAKSLQLHDIGCSNTNLDGKNFVASFLGALWVEDVAAFNLESDFEHRTVLFFKSDSQEKWSGIFIDMNEWKGKFKLDLLNENLGQLLEKVRESLQAPLENGWIVPVVQPLKVVTNEGVYFKG